MQITNDFQARYAAALLSKRHAVGKLEKLIPVFLRSGLEVYPHQIEAAACALLNPYAKGYILADEVGLGKAVEAGLIIAQCHYDGLDNICVVVPKQQIEQWQYLLTEKFGLSVKGIGEAAESDNEQKAVRLMTYEEAVAAAETLKETAWDLVVIDEAHRLRKFRQGENKTAEALHSAFDGRKKILLTATPIIGNVMDLWGLVTFIDEFAFATADAFYNRYYKKPENYPELKELLSPYIFRTLRRQVKADVSLPERLIHTEQYTLSKQEKEIYNDLEKYTANPKKIAFPEMDIYELTLMMTKAFSSSLDAFVKLITNIVLRLEKIGSDEAKSEAQELKAILIKLSNLTVTTKGSTFLRVLHQTMQSLKAKGLPQKAVVFTESNETKDYILGMSMLGNTQYNSVEFKDASSIEEFKQKKNHILVCTDVASEGFNIEFASAVFNFDLPWGLQKVEQRIGRVHRIGQKNDVLVFNFLCNEIFADVRIFELAYRRTVTTADILGSSDNFITVGKSGSQAVADIVATGRNANEVATDFESLQAEFSDFVAENKKEATDILFNTFDEKVAEKTKHYATFIKEKVAETKVLLWNFCKYAIKPYGTVNESGKSLSLTKSLFKSGNIQQITMCLNDDGLRTRSQLITLSNPAIKQLLSFYTGFTPIYGGVTLEINNRCGESGKIAFYSVQFLSNSQVLSRNIFIGQTTKGRELTDSECRELVENSIGAVRKDNNYNEHDLKAIDGLFTAALARHQAEAAAELDAGIAAEIKQIKRRTVTALQLVENEIKAAESELNRLKGISGSERTNNAFAVSQKAHNFANRLALLKQNEFIEKMRLRKQEADNIFVLTERAKLFTSKYCLFVADYTIS